MVFMTRWVTRPRHLTKRGFPDLVSLRALFVHGAVTYIGEYNCITESWQLSVSQKVIDRYKRRISLLGVLNGIRLLYEARSKTTLSCRLTYSSIIILK